VGEGSCTEPEVFAPSSFNNAALSGGQEPPTAQGAAGQELEVAQECSHEKHPTSALPSPELSAEPSRVIPLPPDRETKYRAEWENVEKPQQLQARSLLLIGDELQIYLLAW